MKKPLRSRLLRLAGACLSAAAAFLILSQGVFAEKVYLIRDGRQMLVHTGRTADPEEAIQAAGLELAESDSYFVEETGSAFAVTILRTQNITILDGGRHQAVTSLGETVGSLLNRLGISLGELDRLSTAPEAPTTDGMTITITRIRQDSREVESPLAFDTLYYEDENLEKGQTRVLSEGEAGALIRTVQTTYENGRVTGRRVTKEAIAEEPTPRIILRGSKLPSSPRARKPEGAAPEVDGSTITTASGDVLTYTKKLTVEATAYSCEGYTGTTATGTTARYGAIAVDPSVIPYGTKMYIVSNDGSYIYGYATAEDCGGAIRGNRIDLYFDTVAECYEFGRRDCTVYILE